MSDWDFILAPSSVTITVEMDEVGILFNTMMMINADHFHGGLHEWVGRMAGQLTRKQLLINNLVANHMKSLVKDSKVDTFPEMIERLGTLTDQQSRDVILMWMREHEHYPGDDAILADEAVFLDFVDTHLREKYEAKGEDFDLDDWRLTWHYLQNGQQLRDDMQSYATWFWETHLKEEWNRMRPIAQEAVNAFQTIDFSGMNAFQAIEEVTGRNLRGNDNVEESMRDIDKLIFVPNPHLGPYVSWIKPQENVGLMYVGVRQPKNTAATSTALNRSELLVRLNALADETRLKMLELLTQHNELCAQDFITRLDLSQSSASRHLRQLTASGYVSERRRDVAKCYSLNAERIDDTIRALKDFLS